MIEKVAELEDDAPTLQDHATGVVVDPLSMSDKNEHTDMDMKRMCDVLHELEGGAG